MCVLSAFPSALDKGVLGLGDGFLAKRCVDRHADQRHKGDRGGPASEPGGRPSAQREWPKNINRELFFLKRIQPGKRGFIF